MTLIQTTADTLPEILRATRGAAGYSARALGALVGVSHGTVSAWERGLTEPTVSQFLAWADATGQNAEQLLASLRRH